MRASAALRPRRGAARLAARGGGIRGWASPISPRWRRRPIHKTSWPKRLGTAVADALASLGRRHQVMVVTHLAQVAALADTQIVVTKTLAHVGDGEVTTAASARPVDGDERIDEIARMLSGEQAGASARRHAADLLDERLHLS